MGSYISCNNCGVHKTNYKIIYKNINIDENKNLIFTFQEIDKIYHIVGNIDVKENDMVQNICCSCYGLIEIDKLPNEWGAEVFYNKNGYLNYDPNQFTFDPIF